VVRAKLDDKGRLSIPATLRGELGLAPSDEVVVEREGSNLTIRKVAPEIPKVNTHGGWRRRPVISAAEVFGGP
jgi:AbrB family looped-hinge helix DNA binding protein